MTKIRCRSNLWWNLTMGVLYTSSITSPLTHAFITTATTTVDHNGIVKVRSYIPAPRRPISSIHGVSPESSSIENTSTAKDEGRTKLLLDQALKSNITAADLLLAELTEVRNDSQERFDQILNQLLLLIDNNNNNEKSKFPWWTKIRITTKVSRRSRLASLHRVLNLSTPSSEEVESIGDDQDAERRRRRRSLLIILRSLSSKSQNEDDDKNNNNNKEKKMTIASIERTAKKDLKRNLNAQDMKTRLPPGLETPNYTVLTKRPNYEIRTYESFTTCTVPMSKPRPDQETTDRKVSNPQLKGASSFGALAGYLFGKNEEAKAMKMTTPVLTKGEGEEKEMSFVLPSRYWEEDGLEVAPRPLEGSLVELKREEGGERAVVMFGGFAAKGDVEVRREALFGGLEVDGDWMVDGEVALAQYNDPFTPPWKRRNEVSVPVRRRKKE